MAAVKLNSNAQYKYRWEVNSMTEPDTKYVVSMRWTGIWGCNCPRWKFAKAPKPDCRHITKILETEPLDTARRGISLTDELPFVSRSQVKPIAATTVAAQPQPRFVIQTRRAITLED